MQAGEFRRSFLARLLETFAADLADADEAVVRCDDHCVLSRCSGLEVFLANRKPLSIMRKS